MAAPKDLEAEGAIVVISRSHSYCNACGKEVVCYGANRKRHVDIAGYNPKPGEGCQRRFVAKSTDQMHYGPDDVAGLWRNLPFVWLYLRPEANPRLRVVEGITEKK